MIVYKKVMFLGRGKKKKKKVLFLRWKVLQMLNYPTVLGVYRQ